jgi:phosphate transport system substrate-binding protein
MKKSILSILFTAIFSLNIPAQITLNGAGATFPYPIYSQWAYKYNAITGVQINYQSIGSGGGIQQIKAKTVDFGASDAPLKKEDLDANGLAQFPLIMGGVVPVINVKGINPGELKLGGELLAKIFLGIVDKWNDPAIKSLNPNLNLPDLAIAVIHRADGSGTTWIFTNYLSAVSSDWKTKVGADKAVSWPTGLGGKGNEGVSAYVQQINGSIGYVEYAYALQNKMTYAQLQNKAGKFVSPAAETFSSAAANADWKNAPGFYLVLVDQPGDNSWPITGASFILIYKNQTDAKEAKAMLDYFDWCFKNGKDSALKLDYVPMPDNVIKLVEDMWKAEIKSSGKAVW